MPKEKRNHFVSRGLVQLWTKPNGQVTYWEKIDGKKIELRNPKSVHSEDYLYARWEVDGKRDMSAEKALKNEVDDHSPDQIRNLLKRDPYILPLTHEERMFFARLVVRTVLRNPAILRTLEGKFSIRLIKCLLSLQRWLSRGDANDAAKERLGKDRVLQGDLFHKITTANIDSQVEQIAKMTFVFYTPENDAPNFVLGSQPYIINPHAQNKFTDDYTNDCSFCLVLHPRLALAIYADFGEDKYWNITTKDVQRINGLFIKYSKTVVMVDATDADGAWYWPFGHEGGDKFIQISVNSEPPDEITI